MNPCVYKRPLFFVLLLLIVRILLFYRPTPFSKDISRFISKETVHVIGRVESFAVQKQKTDNIVVAVQKINRQPADGYLYARVQDISPSWKDTVQLTGVLKEPYGTDLIGNFNWRAYLTYKNVFTEMRVQKTHLVKRAAFPYRFIRKVRSSILETFASHFATPLPQIAGGILLGERGDLPPTLFTAFQDSGAIHLLVASGGNVGFVTLLVLACCGLFSIGRRKALLAALIAAGVYTFLAGADAPLVRAYFMTVCATLGYLFRRNSGVFQGLLISCFVILLFHPASLFETGFQMSFLATFAIVLVVSNWKIPSKWPAWVRFFTQIFLATLATQLVLLPIFTNVFYKVSLAGLVANMVLVPLSSFLLGMSSIYYLSEQIHLGFLFYFPTLWGLELFEGLVRFFASFSFSSLAVTSWQTPTIIAYYTGLFLLFHFPLRSFFRKIFIPAGVILLLCTGWAMLPKHTVEIYLLNKWDKNAVIVITPDAQTFVIGTDLEPSKIKAALYKLGHSKVDGLFGFSNKTQKNHLRDILEVKKEVIPFTQQHWPGNVYSFGETVVSLKWGMVVDREGVLTERLGYSGSNEDKVSYCFTTSSRKFCIGENGRFVQQEAKRVFSQRNKTVSLKI